MVPAHGALYADCQAAIVYLRALRDKLRERKAKARQYERRPQGPADGKTGAINWQLYNILNGGVGAPSGTGGIFDPKYDPRTPGAGTGAPWWLGGK